MPKFSQIPANPSPVVGDYVIGHTAGNVDDKITIGQLAALVSANLSSKVMIDRGFHFANNGALVVPTAWTTYNTVTATFSGGAVRVHVTAQIRDGNSGAPRTGHLRVQRDGVTMTSSDEIWHTPTSGAYIYAAAMFSDTPSAGSHTYTFQIAADTGSATTLLQTALHVMEAMP